MHLGIPNHTVFYSPDQAGYPIRLAEEIDRIHWAEQRSLVNVGYKQFTIQLVTSRNNDLEQHGISTEDLALKVLFEARIRWKLEYMRVYLLLSRDYPSKPPYSFTPLYSPHKWGDFLDCLGRLSMSWSPYWGLAYYCDWGLGLYKLRHQS